MDGDSSNVPDSFLSIHDSQVSCDEEEVTPAQVVAEMTTVWQSECAAPCLLPHRMELVECLVDQIDGMEGNLQRCTDKTSVKVTLHRVELQRLTYLVNHYMRTRLKKIEDNAALVLRQNEERVKKGHQPLLADEEIKFARRYSAAHSSLLHTLFSRHLPASVGRVPVPAQDLSIERVFISVVKDDAQDVAIPNTSRPGGTEMVALKQDAVHIIKVEPVLPLLEAGEIRFL